jgi:hypothetical protein
VFRRGPEVIVKPGGFVLWQTKEKVGTPVKNPGLICFVDGKSTRLPSADPMARSWLSGVKEPRLTWKEPRRTMQVR